MVVPAVATRILHLNCATKTAPCPDCGRRGRRKRICSRRVRYAEYKTYAYFDITYGEYRASCSCCTTFRNSPPGVGPKAQYHDSVRRLVLDRILLDGLNVQRTLESIARDFLIDLSPGFVYDVLRQEVARLNQTSNRRAALNRFSGVLCVDELHLGRFTLLLATDPLNDFPVAFALIDDNNQDHMRRFLGNLKTWGLQPRVVVTDGSTLYPRLLKELWPQAEHQLCIFHVLQDINKLVLDAVRRLRTRMSRQANKGRRKGRRGRPTRVEQAARRRRGLSQKEKAAFVFKHRYLIVKRRENLEKDEPRDLGLMLSYLPELAVLRRFADRIYWLFDTEKDRHQAGCRRAVIVKDKAFQGVPELCKAMEQLEAGKFAKMMGYLKRPQEERVRTNNHVERTNRRVRFLEKVRYKWRKRRTLVRFLVLTINQTWKEAFGDDEKPKVSRSRKQSGKTRRIAA